MHRESEVLFAKYELRSVIEGHFKKLTDYIHDIDSNRLLNTNAEDLCRYLVNEYFIQVPSLHPDQITVESKEEEVDITRNRMYDYVPGRARTVKGISIYYYVPYDGDKNLFYARPSTFDFNPPVARVTDSDVIFVYTSIQPDRDQIDSEFQRILSGLQKYISFIQNDINPFNGSLHDNIMSQISKRRDKILKDQNLVSSLGYPLRERKDAPKTYVAPTIRKKIANPLNQASGKPYVPDPELDMTNYEHILKVISSMVHVIERSPNAFKTMKEEDIRQHFLVQLNGQYEGQATGETFNYYGKTDILIRSKDRNIFIAECKFWKGPQYFLDTINQLLGYLNWRDTKAAIIIFNRNKNLSEVIKQIPQLVKSHSNFKRQLSYQSETGFRFILHQKDDINREIILTVLVFDIPK